MSLENLAFGHIEIMKEMRQLAQKLNSITPQMIEEYNKRLDQQEDQKLKQIRKERKYKRKLRKQNKG